MGRKKRQNVLRTHYTEEYEEGLKMHLDVLTSTVKNGQSYLYIITNETVYDKHPQMKYKEELSLKRKTRHFS